MKYAELTRKLRRLGCYPTRFGAGSHEIWRNPASRQQTSVPYHSSKDIGPGLLAAILRQLAVDREKFDAA
jgi:predicted RNA binding protein YcfA (HicA-like mRNA interferase family)